MTERSVLIIAAIFLAIVAWLVWEILKPKKPSGWGGEGE